MEKTEMQVEIKKPTEIESFKVGIVGPSKPKWKNPEQYELMKTWIRRLLKSYQSGFKPIICEVGESPYPSPCGFKFGVKINLPITVVSGHCPVGVEKYWCYDLEKFIFCPNDYAGMGFQFSDKVFDQGGVDTEVEIIAKQLGIQTKIFYAPAKQWENKIVCSDGFHKAIVLGYRDRNILVAKDINIIYCLVPQTYIPLEGEEVLTDLPSDIYCWHCGELGHPRNGGCDTLRRAKKLGKETHLVVIK